MKGLFRLGGPWALAVFFLAGTKTGRKLSKKVADEAVKSGKVIAEKGKEVFAQLQESASNIIEEAKTERAAGSNNGHTVDVRVD